MGTPTRCAATRRASSEAGRCCWSTSRAAVCWGAVDRALAFTSGQTGNADVYTINADGSGRRDLTADPADELAPAWSPDGRRIAFVRFTSDGRGAVWIMNADGSGQRRLTPARFEGSVWDVSPDGKHLLVGNHGNTSLAFTTNRSFASRGIREDEIWEMSADGSGMHPVTSSVTVGGCPDDHVDNCVGPVDGGRRP